MLLCENLPPSGVCESHSEPHLRHRQKKLNIILSYGLAVIKGALQGGVALGRHDKHFDTTASDSTVAKDKNKEASMLSPSCTKRTSSQRTTHKRKTQKKRSRTSFRGSCHSSYCMFCQVFARRRNTHTKRTTYTNFSRAGLLPTTRPPDTRRYNPEQVK